MEEKKPVNINSILQSIAVLKGKVTEVMSNIPSIPSDDIVDGFDDLSNSIISHENAVKSLIADLENITYSIPYYNKKDSSKALRKIITKLDDLYS